jgi:recombination protein RecA
MVKRRIISQEAAETAEEEVGTAATSYFSSGADKGNLKFISSGCMVMDEALGGGYALGRVVNIVGDRSSGKTLKAMEICAQFFRKYPKGLMRYAESEAAFDREYAGALGIPVDRIIFNEDSKYLASKKDGAGMMETVEDWYEDALSFLALVRKSKQPGLYILDSLDALSDEAEQKRDFDEGSYGGTKPKQIGKLFRTTVGTIEELEVLFVIVSQIRDKLNVTFGETKTRSGGRALDFYSTHIVWLAEVKKLEQTKDGIKRIIGVQVEANVKKNKVGLPFRRAQYPILFGYGIDDLTAGLEWLIQNNGEAYLKELGFSKDGYKVRVASLRNKGGQDAKELRLKLTSVIRQHWAKIENTFLPRSKKYD